MKTSSTFKMSKSIKRALSLFPFKNSHDRGTYKKLMIESQLHSLVTPKLSKSAESDPA